MSDITTIIWKELKEQFQQRGSARSGLVSLLIFVGLIGIFMPLNSGPEWLTNPVLLLAWSWLPIFLTASMVSDSFAGERERHTLETLLASRLSDSAILLGKILAAVLYGWMITVVGLLVGVVTVNVAFPDGGVRFYDPGAFAAAVVFSLLGCLLMAALGVLVSLKSATARQAYQKLSFSYLGLFILVFLGAQIMPAEMKKDLAFWFSSLNMTQVALIAAVVLIVIDVALVTACRLQFKRSKLMLEE